MPTARSPHRPSTGGAPRDGFSRTRGSPRDGYRPRSHQRKPPRRRPTKVAPEEAAAATTAQKTGASGTCVGSDPPCPRFPFRPLKRSGTHATPGSPVDDAGVESRAVATRGCPTSSDVGTQDASIASAASGSRAGSRVHRCRLDRGARRGIGFPHGGHGEHGEHGGTEERWSSRCVGSCPHPSGSARTPSRPLAPRRAWMKLPSAG